MCCNEIDNPERYILGGCVEDLWLAVSALTALYPGLDGRIGYIGVSFGGGVGALAMAFDKRIDRGHLVVPTFGNMPLWLTLPTVGSAPFRAKLSQAHGDVLETLSLFDAATAATRIAVPMLMAVARFDPAVAPPCQFSVANALSTSNLHETVILDAGHFEYSGMRAQHTLLQRKSDNSSGRHGRDYRRWRSPALQRDMELLIFGHAGAKVLMFPTRDGRFWEYENLNIVGSLADKVDAGHLQLFCIEGWRRRLSTTRPSSCRAHPPACRVRGLHAQ